jgi:hypothetical protein
MDADEDYSKPRFSVLEGRSPESYPDLKEIIALRDPHDWRGSLAGRRQRGSYRMMS